MKKVFISLLLFVGIIFYAPNQAEACGGQTASLGNVDGNLVAWTHADGNPRAMDYRANIKPKQASIPPALAEAIAQKYVSTYFPNAESIDFHAFLYEHGRYAYMYDITDLSISNTSTITGCGSNLQKSESNSEDIHIDAVTGDVWDGQGCGGGPSKIIMRYNPSDYPAELATETKDLIQFHSDFVISDSEEVVMVDGKIDENEWREAATMQLEQYGKIVEIKSKIENSVIYWAIETDTKNWLALLLKTSPHHGMAWEFSDAKLLSENGVEDYNVEYKGMMVGAGLKKDITSTILSQSTSETENGRIYEFSMPIQSGREGVDFRIGEYGNMAFYFGASPTFSGQLVSDDAFSKQIVMHIGEEIHRSVISKIIPTAIAATFGESATGKNNKDSLSNKNKSLYIIVITIVLALIIMYREKLSVIIKK